jgi:hypothetical protein
VRRRFRSIAVLGLVACGASVARVGTPSGESAQETLAFAIHEGNLGNYFYRSGPISAHVLVRSGTSPRVVVAFPAGNAGAGLWFEDLSDAAELSVTGGVDGLTEHGLRGILGSVYATTPRLVLRLAVLGSIRAVRDADHSGEARAELAPEVAREGGGVTIRRTTAGRRHLEVTLAPMGGAHATVDGRGRVILTAAEGARAIRFRLVALQDDPPLTPIAASEILMPGSIASPRDLRALAFLTYREKLLAGSWRFLTYFGRDTLLSLRLLLPVLRPEVVEAALGSVIDRLDPEGQVAHEEDIGEWAALANAGDPDRASDLEHPRYDYKMIDDDFLLAPVLAAWALDTPAGRERAGAFLRRQTPDGRTYAQALEKNLEYVLGQAAPFAQAPGPTRLVGLRDGNAVGEWRDSEQGLGGGRFAYDVNVALVPAALDAAARLHESPLGGRDAEAAARARALATAWAQAGSYFRVELSAETARARIEEYASEQGLELAARPALASIEGPVAFPALALDAAGRPIPVMHSDEGFLLLFGHPSAEELDQSAQLILRPFPAGLLTPVGIVVANPAMAPDPAVRALFGRGHYHGTVVWSWQQAMLAAGLERQLARDDLPDATRERLEEAQTALWGAIRATDEVRTSELWTWAPRGSRIDLVPFGQESGHHDESNAVQLWSTVYLAVRPP